MYFSEQPSWLLIAGTGYWYERSWIELNKSVLGIRDILYPDPRIRKCDYRMRIRIQLQIRLISSVTLRMQK